MNPPASPSSHDLDIGRLALEHAAAGIVVSDRGGRWLHANPALRAMLGHPGHPSSAGSFAEIVEPDDLARLDDTWAATIADGSTGTCQVRVRRDDGSVTLAQVTLAPAPDRERPDVMVATIIPVQHFGTTTAPGDRLGDVLAERERWLQAIFEFAPVQIVLKDLDGRIMGISGNVATDLGIPVEDFIGRTTADFLPADIAAKYMAADRLVAETGRATQGEVVEPGDDGTRHYVMAKFPIRDRAGSVTAICSLTTEITDLRRSEEELQRAHDVLEREVRERTAELELEIEERRRTEAELRSAKEAAENASLAKSRFLSSMSHELRTPMNAILGFAELIHLPADDPAADLVNEYADHIVASARHLMHLIEQVLDLSTIEAGRLHVQRSPIDVAAVVAASIRLVSHRAAANGITLSSEVPSGLPAALADADRTRQVLLNLLTNAVKYNRPSGSVTVTATADDDHVRLSVIDTGEGIPASRVDALFEPFERLGLESSAIEGTGIGLSITKAIVEAMGGRIGVSSEEGVGSVFWVDLRRSDR